MGDLVTIAVVLAISAVPFGEAVVAAPLGIGLGLSGPLAFVLATAGNVAGVVGVLYLCRRWPRLQGRLVQGRRGQWVARRMARGGVIGLVLQAPVLSGSHVAALVGVLVGARPRLLLMGLSLSILGWGAAATVLALQGKRLIIGFLA